LLTQILYSGFTTIHNKYKDKGLKSTISASAPNRKTLFRFRVKTEPTALRENFTKSVTTWIDIENWVSLGDIGQSLNTIITIVGMKFAGFQLAV
jgi:hypothetical protein